MNLAIWDDTERSDDRLKYTEDRQATGSGTGHRENTHLHFKHNHTHLCVILDYFPELPNLVGMCTGSRQLDLVRISTKMHAQSCTDLFAIPELTSTHISIFCVTCDDNVLYCGFISRRLTPKLS